MARSGDSVRRANGGRSSTGARKLGSRGGKRAGGGGTQVAAQNVGRLLEDDDDQALEAFDGMDGGDPFKERRGKVSLHVHGSGDDDDDDVDDMEEDEGVLGLDEDDDDDQESGDDDDDEEEEELDDDELLEEAIQQGGRMGQRGCVPVCGLRGCVPWRLARTACPAALPCEMAAMRKTHVWRCMCAALFKATLCWTCQSS
jgi:hypothetical protein